MTNSPIPPDSASGPKWTRIAKTAAQACIWEQKGEGGKPITGIDILIDDAQPKGKYPLCFVLMTPCSSTLLIVITFVYVNDITSHVP